MTKWYWKHHKEISSSYPMANAYNAEILANGDLENWESGTLTTGSITEMLPTLDGNCVSNSSPFDSLELNAYGPGQYSDTQYQSSYWFDTATGRTYHTITRRSRDGSVLGSFMYYADYGLRSFYTANVFEISSTNLVWILTYVSFPHQEPMTIILPIPSSIPVGYTPMSSLTINTNVPEYGGLHQRGFHELNQFSADKRIYSCNITTNIVTDIGASPFTGDWGQPFLHLNSSFMDSWVVTTDYGTYDTQHVTNMEGTKTAEDFIFQHEVILGNNDYRFQRVSPRNVSPAKDGFPILGISGTTEILVPNDLGVYSFANPVDKWDINKCELFALYSPVYNYNKPSFVFWYFGKNNMYILTHNRTEVPEMVVFNSEDILGSGGNIYYYDVWKYSGVGTASVGKHTIAASKIDNKYGSIS